MVAERLAPPPRLRHRNPAVSPAVESIVRRCLAPDPDRRYQSARELKEDIERHLRHLPLRHAAEPSVRERLQKWRRRHPFLASAATLGTAAAVVVAVLAAAIVVRGQRLTRLQALDHLRRTGEDARTAQLLLLDRGAGLGQKDEGVQLCRAALDRYRVLDDPSWRESPAVRALTPPQRDRLAEDVGDLLFLLARA